MNGIDNPEICWAGDGGTYDIGLATLSAAAERNEDIIYICYDNEIYGNTGGQRSGATPVGAVTATTPAGKGERKKDIMAIMAAHRIPYAATLSISHREDFLRKIRYARSVSGFRFLLMLSPCPTGWKSEPDQSTELVEIAVRSGLFPLYEIFDGCRYRINQRPDHMAVDSYIEQQRRFSQMWGDPEALNAHIDAQWRYLDGMATVFPAKESPVPA
jgi:pyruvate ferredoxin oxidoreductase beta subunit/2-oxoisovalerate ferredoxin oxidoreductase beta subunit